MQLNEYQKLAERTSNPKLTPWQKMQNGCYGMCGEAGECIDKRYPQKFTAEQSIHRPEYERR